MSLSKKCVQTMLDLVEIKLSTIQVSDREDAREAAILKTCRDELSALLRRNAAAAAASRSAQAQPAVHA
jgi:hypothetical protein